MRPLFFAALMIAWVSPSGAQNAHSRGADNSAYSNDVTGANISQAWTTDYYFEKTSTDEKSWRMRSVGGNDWVELRQISRNATQVFLQHPDGRIFILHAPSGPGVKELRVIEPQSGQRTLSTLSAYSRRSVAVAGGSGAENLRRICFDGGIFEQTGPATWAEKNANGQTTFTFEETGRSGEMVSLNDRSRNVQIYFRPGSGEILLGQNGGPARRQWDITCTGLGPQPEAPKPPAPPTTIAQRPTPPQLPADRPTAPQRTIRMPATPVTTAPAPAAPPLPAEEEPDEIGPMEYAGFACSGNPGYWVQETIDGSWQQVDSQGRAIANLRVDGRNEQLLHLFDGSSLRHHFVNTDEGTVRIQDLRTGQSTLICSNLEGTRVTALLKQPLFTPPVLVDPVPDWQKGGLLASNFYEVWNRPFEEDSLTINDVGGPYNGIKVHIQGMAHRKHRSGIDIYAFVTDFRNRSDYMLTLCNHVTCYDTYQGTDKHPGGGVQFLGNVLITSDEEDRTEFFDTADVTKPKKLRCSIPEHGGAAGLTWDRTNKVHVATIGNGGGRQVYVSNGNDLDSPRCKFKRVTKSDGEPANMFLNTPGEGLSQLFWDDINKRIVAIGDSGDDEKIYYQTFSLGRRDGEWFANVGKKSVAKTFEEGPLSSIFSASLRWGGTIVMYEKGFDLIVSRRNANVRFAGRSDLETILLRAR